MLNFRDSRKHTQQQIESSSVFAVSQALMVDMCETTQTDGAAILLIRIRCKTCRFLFYLCRSCFRGQAYCCDLCRAIAATLKHRKVQSRYRTSTKGRKANRIAAKRRRLKKREKSVADEGSIPQANSAILPPFSLLKQVVCLFCGISGKVVTRFPRRGYRSHSTSRNPVISKSIAWRHDEKNSGSYSYSPDP